MHINVEFKAHCYQPDRIREVLEREGAEYRGRDHQIDVYFNVQNGRLKLRKGNIENSLIAYERKDYAGTKQSNVHLVRLEPGTNLEQVLTTALGIKVVVDKKRDIYLIDNVKFHVDEVEGLGSFMEVEAIDSEGTIGRQRLQEQCDYYRDLFEIKDENMVPMSYSDMLLNLKKE